MCEFFKGWRRKAGGVTLVMAMLAMGGWVRSLIREDVFVLNKGDATTGLVVSKSGSLNWRQAYLRTMPDGAWEIEHLDVSPFPDPKEDIQWMWWFAGNGVGKIDDTEPEISVQCVVIAYQSVAIPLTLLSACLLLKKTRPAKPAPAHA